MVWCLGPGVVVLLWWVVLLRVGLLFEFCIVDASIFVVCCVCLVFCLVTSYEGHMVDALASRADEGRWSLR